MIPVMYAVTWTTLWTLAGKLNNIHRIAYTTQQNTCLVSVAYAYDNDLSSMI